MIELSELNSYQEAGNGAYAQNHYRPVCGAPAEDAAQALRPEHQGDGVGISFCRCQFLLPLFQETYRDDAAAGERMNTVIIT